MTADDVAKIDKSEKRLRKWLVGLGIVVMIVLGSSGFFVLNQHYSHVDAKSTACNAVEKNNAIFKEFVVHIRDKSIQNVKAGVTSQTTSLKEIKHFFHPTIKAINEVSCNH
jgi:hypothetical protein